jgi:SNF2 family DNA or RNA helicase
LEQKRVARECAEWIKQKVEIRSVKRAGLLHGKLYHVDNNGVEQAILGSSNFTVHGLGLGAEGHNNFEQYLDEQRRSNLLAEQSQIVDTEIWRTLFEFQRDGVKGAINKILKHNGCVIAGSVGLGKTYEALAIIKYFELRNDKVLVLCPKKLRDNWTVYQATNRSLLNPFERDRFSYTVLSHTDLSRDGGRVGDIDLSLFNWGAFDLVVIDESHNFRNNVRGRRDEEGNVIRKSRYERLMDDIVKSGVKTKVLLLSATPVNNDLKDLRNQLYFLTEARSSVKPT